MEIYHRSTVNEMIKPKVLSSYIKICDGNEFKQRPFTKSYGTSVRIFITDLSKVNLQLQYLQISKLIFESKYWPLFRFYQGPPVKCYHSYIIYSNILILYYTWQWLLIIGNLLSIPNRRKD